MKPRWALQMLWTTWGQINSILFPLTSPAKPPRHRKSATAGSTEAPRPWAPPYWCLWKRSDQISTGWRCQP